MEISLPTLSGQKWTCADLLSSYRFWGMLLFFFLINISYTLSSTYNYYFWHNTLGIDMRDISSIIPFTQFGLLSGLILTWFLCRLKNRYPLYIVGLLLLAGTLCHWLVNDASQYFWLATGTFLSGVSQGAITLLIPMLLAVAVGSVEAFAVAFGFCLFANVIIKTCLPIFLYKTWTENLSTTCLVIVVLALLVLIPIKASLFYAPPSQRKSSTQRSEHAEPVNVALLAMIVPFYKIYWFVRIHREMQSAMPSSRLMTAHGAGWISALVPLGTAMLCLMLSDEMCSQLANKEKETGVKTGWVLLWGLLFPPVGIAMLQEKCNRLMAASVNQDINENT